MKQKLPQNLKIKIIFLKKISKKRKVQKCKHQTLQQFHIKIVKSIAVLEIRLNQLEISFRII